MIKIDTTKISEHKDYDKMETHVEISGSGEIIKEEIKTLFQYCKRYDNLRIIVIQALTEVLRDDN